MAQKEHQEDIEERLRQKSVQGILNIANSFLSDPEVKRLIRRITVIEGLRMGVVLAFLFTGLVSLFNCIRNIMQSPLVDLALGVALISVALIVLVRDLWQSRRPLR